MGKSHVQAEGEEDLETEVTIDDIWAAIAAAAEPIQTLQPGDVTTAEIAKHYNRSHNWAKRKMQLTEAMDPTLTLVKVADPRGYSVWVLRKR